MEREILKKQQPSSPRKTRERLPSSSPRRKWPQYPIGLLCKTLNVSRPGYYAHVRRPRSKHATRDESLGAKIVAIHTQSNRIYGSPRVCTMSLRDAGECVSRKRVIRLMRERDLRGKRRRRFRVTTQSGPRVAARDEHACHRDFNASAPNQNGWATSRTYGLAKAGSILQCSSICFLVASSVGSMSNRLTTDLPAAGADDGHCIAPSAAWPRASHRSWMSVLRVPNTAPCLPRRHGLVAEHESQRQLLGQRRSRELLRDTQDRGLVRDIDFITHEHARREVFSVHRGLLQSAAAPFVSWLCEDPNRFELTFEESREAA